MGGARRGLTSPTCKRKGSPCQQDGDGDSPAAKAMKSSVPDLPEISPCFHEDDMLRIKPLELRLHFERKNEISRSLELTNGTRNCIAFYNQLPSTQYSAQPVKGAVQPGSMYVVTITMQSRDVRKHDHVDKFVVQSMKESEGLRDEDITECMFHAEVGKVVDEVDVMVVYEATKPEENCKRREDTNMPAEEFPEAKKREMVESASRKGKNKIGSGENAEALSMDVNSGARGQCVEQTEQCKWLPLQSFSRHHPTCTKYLGKESPAVDRARGAMGSLIDKLGKLVTQDYNLDMSMKTNIESFSEDLKNIHRELPKLENVDGAEDFVDEVREISYSIEDMVDSFLVHVEPNSNGIGFRELTHEGLKLWENGMMNHHQIGDVIRDIKNQVQVVVRKKKHNFKVNNFEANATDKAAIEELRISAINIGIEQLIGIEAPRDEIIDLFEKDGNISKQNLKIVCIVGLGGLGKTTLAKAVYEKLSKAKNYSRGFVPVGQNPVTKEVLKNIISAFENGFNAENFQLWQLCEKLKIILENKRYLIFIDDIWDRSDWERLRSAFPENKCGSRVITTTRNYDVALACCYPEDKYVYWIKPLSKEASKKLFFRRIRRPEKDCPIALKDISVAILKTCGGMPLAINSIASLLRGKEQTTWEYVRKSLGALTEGKTGCESMKKILDLSYMHLPDYLKTCLLYICKYQEDEEIDKNDLLRQWVAEGFVHVSTNNRMDAEDVAEDYFQKLISMCMLQPEKIDYNNVVLSCRVNDIILDLMRSKSSEVNFIQVIDGLKDVSGPRGEIRRASVQNNDKGGGETIKGSLSHVRSVLLYRRLLLPDFLKYKYVRVLHLEDNEVFSEGTLDLTCISSLFFLRYLKIACYRTIFGQLKLPDQIGQLQQLETIDLQGGRLKNIPSDIVSLPRLSHLRYGGEFWVRKLPLPYGIERLKSLRTLEGVCVGRCSVETINGLGELTNLRNLGIDSYFPYPTEEAEKSARMTSLHSSILRLSTSLRVLTFESGGLSGGHDLSPQWGRTLFPEGSYIEKLHLRGCTFPRFPEWIGQLRELYSLSILVREVTDGVSIAARLPSLAYFRLEIDVLKNEKEETVVISGSRGAFHALKYLIFHCPKTSLTFEKGALPKLEKLDIMFPLHIIRRSLPVGIQHLPAPTLKQIFLRVNKDWSTYAGWKVKGSEHWNYLDWSKYFRTAHYREKKQNIKESRRPC